MPDMRLDPRGRPLRAPFGRGREPVRVAGGPCHGFRIVHRSPGLPGNGTPVRAHPGTRAMAAGMHAPGWRDARRVMVLAGLALAGFAPAARGDEGGFRLPDGDRVLSYGDSVTERGLYTAVVETYVVTRYPGLDVTFANAGRGGDTVRGGAGGPADLRLARDVVPARPTVVTIMLGTNDRRPTPGGDGAGDEAFLDGYRPLVEAVRAALPGVRVTLLTPPPYDDVTRPADPAGGNAVLAGLGRLIAGYARDAGL